MTNLIIKEIKVNDLLTKSKLPSADYVINSYVGCTHGCKYCYASFMKRFTNHQEEWGSFIDIKLCNKELPTAKLTGKSVFLSSVTDCYNHLEEKYRLTQNILRELKDIDCTISISTKSKLILRDLELLKQCKNLVVSISINTLDEKFRESMDKASSIKERLETLKILHENGIYTVLFMSPIFPYLTKWREIIEISKDYVDEYWFENLNLRGSYKKTILDYINTTYPIYYPEYLKIYNNKDKSYWQNLAEEINAYCTKNNIKYINYFYHEEIKKK